MEEKEHIEPENRYDELDEASAELLNYLEFNYYSWGTNNPVRCYEFWLDNYMEHHKEEPSDLVKRKKLMEETMYHHGCYYGASEALQRFYYIYDIDIELEIEPASGWHKEAYEKLEDIRNS